MGVFHHHATESRYAMARMVGVGSAAQAFDAAMVSFYGRRTGKGLSSYRTGGIPGGTAKRKYPAI